MKKKKKLTRSEPTLRSNINPLTSNIKEQILLVPILKKKKKKKNTGEKKQHLC